MTQGRLGASIGLSRTSITNIEKGRQKLLIDTLWVIARVLGVPGHELLPREDSIRAPFGHQLPKDVSPRARRLIEELYQKAIISR